ncbi:SH3-domain GRB2-like 1b isoform 1-T1 [Pholidichthys leucotaenia]
MLFHHFLCFFHLPVLELIMSHLSDMEQWVVRLLEGILAQTQASLSSKMVWEGRDSGAWVMEAFPSLWNHPEATDVLASIYSLPCDTPVVEAQTPEPSPMKRRRPRCKKPSASPAAAPPPPSEPWPAPPAEELEECRQKVDVTSKAVVEVISKTSEYLQPNPASRAKLSMLNTMSKIRGQVKNPGYPQAEGLLGECMAKYGRELGEDTNFGGALVDVGEAMKRLAEVKDSLDIDVKQNFIDPLQGLCDKDLREIQHHLKKLEGRRLDYDYKKKRQGKIPDEEVRQALEKFHETKEVAESSMYHLLETDIEQVSQLSALVESQLQYHRQAVQVLDELSDKLRDRINEAQSRPRREYTPKPKPIFDFGDNNQSNGGYSTSVAPPPSRNSAPEQPSCKALYDFEPENEGELGFHEGDIITLTNQIDENWYEGMLNGQSGFFPLNYVKVLVPLPH